MKFFPTVMMCVGWSLSATTLVAAEPPSSARQIAKQSHSIMIEAWIDGATELRVTKTGIYWIAKGDKPGQPGKLDECTYVDGQPWKPIWGKPEERKGPDKSEEYPLAMAPEDLMFQLIAVSSSRSEYRLDERDPIKVKMVDGEFSVTITDSQGGARWYRFALGDQAAIKALNSDSSRMKLPEPIAAAAPTITPLPPTAPISSTGSVSAAELVKTYRNSLVFVNGNQGSGSGFLATYATGNYVFTNAHVAAGIKGAGFKTLEGTDVKVGAASVAVGHDIFLLQTSLNGKPFEVMKSVEENTTIGDEVVVLGNAEGAGVINTLTGKIVGIGPKLVEIDAPFVPGNSGSPIIHLKTGKVIGVATYLTIKKYDPATKQPIKDPVVRRFGYRIDSVKSWQPVNWTALYAQAAEMDNIEKMTDDLDALLRLLVKEGRIDTQGQTNPTIKSRINAWVQATSGRQLSAVDRSKADQNFLAFLKTICQSDVTAARQHLTYDYFQRGLTEQQETRNQMSEFFSKIIEAMNKAR